MIDDKDLIKSNVNYYILRNLKNNFNINHKLTK